MGKKRKHTDEKSRPWLIPALKQFREWSLPSKLTAFGTYVGIIALVLTFIALVLTNVFVAYWLIGMLPGPKVSAEIRILEGSMLGTTNVTGGTYYVLTIETDKPLEYLNLIIQLPNAINNCKVGFPQQLFLTQQGDTRLQAWELGTDSTGQKNVIVQAAITNTVDVTTSFTGNTISIKASKLERNAVIWGAIATTTGNSTVYPAPPFYSEGVYEYSKFGMTIRKPFTASFVKIN